MQFVILRGYLSFLKDYVTARFFKEHFQRNLMKREPDLEEHKLTIQSYMQPFLLWVCTVHEYICASNSGSRALVDVV